MTASTVSECYMDPLGRDYRGHVSKTNTGKRCQLWSAQSPHAHTRTPSEYPNAGLGRHNYCRNPDNQPSGPWCYTMDANVRFEYCDVGRPRQSCDDLGEYIV